MPFNLSSFYMAPIWASRNNEISKRQTNENDYDFNPLEFYRSLESIIESYGFDKSCWKRSICELARHPFERIDDNWLIDLVTFVMTPSQFKIISAHEAEEQPNPYNLAEHLGRSGKLCHHLYPKCKNDPLNMLTIVFE
ncbi:uncharacterized protein LOC106088883 [Stomoxys calcitrans]|uniref:Uncharacterized protein n=1 Tax=Stomoxys calcitrans TaxID=35570 RepID=A0A1I8P0C0_STOCA|nr:uncharacterized protein LOC106088883 [Stomoxys calcitrans]